MEAGIARERSVEVEGEVVGVANGGGGGDKREAGQGEFGTKKALMLFISELDRCLHLSILGKIESAGCKFRNNGRERRRG